MLATIHPDKLKSYDLRLNSLLALATCLGVGVVYCLAVLPFDVQSMQVQSQIESLQETVQQASSISQEQQTLKQKLEKSEREAAALLLRIPTAPRESDFLAQVCHLAGEVGLEVTDYRTGATQILDNHREMEVRISTRGKYESLCRFMERVNQFPRLSRVAQLDVVSSDQPAGTRAVPVSDSDVAAEKTLSAEFVYRIYFAPPSDAAQTKKP